MEARCFMNCTGEPVIDGKPTRFYYRKGQMYEISPNDSWAIWFEDPVTGKRIKEPPVHKAKGQITPHKKPRKKKPRKIEVQATA